MQKETLFTFHQLIRTIRRFNRNKLLYSETKQSGLQTYSTYCYKGENGTNIVTLNAPAHQTRQSLHQSKGRHILLGGLFLCLFLWGIGSIFTWQSYQSVITRAQTHTANLGTRLSQHTATSIKTVDFAIMRSVDYFAKNWDNLKEAPLQAHEFLTAAFSGMTQLRDVIVLSEDGKALFTHRYDYTYIKQDDGQQFTLQTLPNPARRLVIERFNDDNTIGLSRPIYNSLGKLNGYIVAKIRIGYLKEIYQTGLDKQEHSIALYNKTSRLLSLPDSNAPYHDTQDHFISTQSQTLNFRHNQLSGLETINASTKVPDYDLIITIDTAFKNVLKPWQQQTVAYTVIGIIFSSLILIYAYLIQRSFQTLQRENLIRQQTEISLKKLSRAIEQSPTSVVITDANASIEYVNPKFTEVSGYHMAEVIGKNPKILSAQVEDHTDYQLMWETLLAGKDWRGEFCNCRKDGSIYWESAAISSLKDETGTITHFLAVKEDITERKRADEQLQLAAAVFEAASEAIMVCNADNIIETVNSAFSEITGYCVEEVTGKTPAILKSGRHDAEFYNRMISKLNKIGRWEGEIWNRRKNGEIYPQWLSIKTIHDETGKIVRFISLFSDITLRKRNEERILYQANYDALTGLPNRSLFMDRLQRAIIQAERSNNQIALLFIDLDRFKNVNDTLGHACGDLLLQEAAARLNALVRRSDTVARLGGDEFTVILSELTDFTQIEHLVEKLLKSLSAPYDLEKNVAFVSASIGITIFPNDGANVDDLLKNADTAMYKAKENGRNLSQFFTTKMNDQANERRALETALHQALEREEFVLHYQPIVDAQTGMLISCETLLRWHQPEHGNIFPDKFIPLAEDTGLIIPIGAWVLEKACFEAVNWAKKMKNPPNISVNMSSRQFQRADVVELVRDTLDKTGLDPHRLTLEITESLLIVDDEEIVRQLHDVRKLGVGLSIDDFGTGYSSLSYLRRFPITTLKIDRAFILDLTSDDEAAAVVSAILSMANSLHMKVVAEGVEEREQLDILRVGGCDYIQGYYYSPPVPIEAFRLMVQQEGPLEPDE